ncbi:MAG: MFS transporter [Desulfobacterales bacterium]|nr:MFS transporter [Desulfobacterales bacterium]
MANQSHTQEKNLMQSPVALSMGTILLYNMAGFAFNLYDTVLYAWLPYFYAPPESTGKLQYVSLTVFGVILMLGRILDAVTDPLIGYWSDRTRTRWGRRKPFIFVSGPILFLTFILVWTPPVQGISLLNGVYLGAILFFYYWAYTGLLIPWLATVPELSQENAGRVKIISVGIVIGIIGAMVGGGLSGPLLEMSSPLVMAAVLGAVAFVASELTLLGVKENYSPPESAPPDNEKGFFTTWKKVFIDKHVLSFSAMIMMVQMTYQLMLMNVPYMTTLILKRNESDASLLMGEIILLMALSTPVWYMLLKKYPKRWVMRVIILLMALGFVASFYIGSLPGLSPMTQALFILPVAALPMGGMFTASLALISDLTDYGELKHGARTEAIYFGIYGIVRKAGWAVCSLILTYTLTRFGYSVENPLGVRMIWIICAGCCVAGLLLFIPYRIGDSKSQTQEMIRS